MTKRIVWDYVLSPGIVEPAEFVVRGDSVELGRVPGAARSLIHTFPDTPFAVSLVVDATDGTTTVSSDPFIYATQAIGQPTNLRVEAV